MWGPFAGWAQSVSLSVRFSYFVTVLSPCVILQQKHNCSDNVSKQYLVNNEYLYNWKVIVTVVYGQIVMHMLGVTLQACYDLVAVV